MGASEKLAELRTERARVVARVDDLDRQAREATIAAQTASAALIEHERAGGPAAKRRELEQNLAQAKAKAAEPWLERIEGTRASVPDADRATREFIAAHLDDLLADLHADGQAVAERVNAAAAELVAAFTRRERIAAEISQLASQVARVDPGDVSFSKAEALSREAARFVQLGGETPPELQRDRWQPQLTASTPA